MKKARTAKQFVQRYIERNWRNNRASPKAKYRSPISRQLTSMLKDRSLEKVWVAFEDQPEAIIASFLDLLTHLIAFPFYNPKLIKQRQKKANSIIGAIDNLLKELEVFMPGEQAYLLPQKGKRRRLKSLSYEKIEGLNSDQLLTFAEKRHKITPNSPLIVALNEFREDLSEIILKPYKNSSPYVEAATKKRLNRKTYERDFRTRALSAFFQSKLGRPHHSLVAALIAHLHEDAALTEYQVEKNTNFLRTTKVKK